MQHEQKPVVVEFWTRRAHRPKVAALPSATDVTRHLQRLYKQRLLAWRVFGKRNWLVVSGLPMLPPIPRPPEPPVMPLHLLLDEAVAQRQRAEKALRQQKRRQSRKRPKEARGRPSTVLAGAVAAGR